MGKAEIIEDKGAGYYSIKRVWSGREAAQTKIDLINTNLSALRSDYSTMPEGTEDEIFAKHIVKLQIASLEKQVQYIQNNFPADIEVDAYCADYTEELSGEVGTIDIPGEVTALVNIRPGYAETAAFDAERDGEFWPSIAVGPWTCFLNKCILPGWQKWFPKYRNGWIVAGSIDYDDNTCAVTIQPAFSSQQNLDVNEGDGFGAEIVEEDREVNYFKVDSSSVVNMDGFFDFCERNPDHPICANEEIGTPVELSDSQYEQIRLINYDVNESFRYQSDQSGFGVADYWDIMLDPDNDTGDCEDFALTKAHRIIEAGILPAKNMQLIGVTVQELWSIDGVRATVGHALLGIQTLNRGFIMLDNRYASPMTYDALKRIYTFGDFQIAGETWAVVQRLKGEVPIEYMDCDAAAFSDGDSVVVEFGGQDWANPKVVGFAANPADCNINKIFVFGINPGTEDKYFAVAYAPATDSWRTVGPQAVGFAALKKTACKATRNGGKSFISGGWTRGDDYRFEEPWPDGIDWCDVDGCSSVPYSDTWLVWNVRYDTFMFNGMIDTWKTTKDYPAPRRCKHVGWFISDRHYMCAGTGYPHGWLEFWLSSYNGMVDNQSHVVHSGLDAYSEAADAYETKLPMPRALQKSAEFAFGALGFVAGGNTQTYAVSPPVGWMMGEDDVRRYSSVDNSWLVMKSLPQSRFDCAGFSINGFGYVTRGHEGTGVFTDGVEVVGIYPSNNPVGYDNGLDAWKYIKPHPVIAWRQAIRGHCGAAVKGLGYSISMSLSGYGHELEQYHPDSDTWTVKAKKNSERTPDLTAT